MVMRDSATRRKQILSATLAVLRKEGPSGTTTAKIAADANCSKETIYNWFGDREGLFSDLIKMQSDILAQMLGQVAGFENVEDGLNRQIIRERFLRFGSIVLDVFSGDAHVLTNRAAIASIGETDNLAFKVSETMYFQVHKVAKQLIDRAITAGLFKADNPDQVYTDYMGLLMGDIPIRLLLGQQNSRPAGGHIDKISGRALENLLKIYPV